MTQLQVLKGGVRQGKDMRFARLVRARLDGVILDFEALGVPHVPQLDTAVLAAIEQERYALEMMTWHTCETTHCRAGWAIHLAGDAGYKLEARFGPSVAGSLIYAHSYPGRPIPDFLASPDHDIAKETVCHTPVRAPYHGCRGGTVSRVSMAGGGKEDKGRRRRPGLIGGGARAASCKYFPGLRPT